MYARSFRFPSLTVEHPLEAVARLAFCAAIALCVALYIYCIAASTFNIIARKQAENGSMAAQSRLAQINAEYYALSERVTPSEAGNLGLVPIKEKSYVTRTAALGFVGGNQ